MDMDLTGQCARIGCGMQLPAVPPDTPAPNYCSFDCQEEGERRRKLEASIADTHKRYGKTMKRLADS